MIRKAPPIAEERLRACLWHQYGLSIVAFEFLPLGLDYSAGVYRATSEQGTAYLLKATARPLYEARYVVPRYLYDQGITAVVAPLTTKSGALWTTLAEWTVIVYPFIEGITSWAGITDEQWMEVGAIFKRIHEASPPSVGFASLRKETFAASEYIDWIHAFEAQLLSVHDAGSAAVRALCADWQAHQPLIHAMMAALEKLAEVIQTRTLPYVICHADLHANNLIRKQTGQVFVIDWDDVMLAPKERDFIFVRDPYAASFFRGYGQVEIDWVVLTYYMWERVIQDVIEDAKNVCFRDDLSEETKAEIAQTFREYRTEGGNIAAAYAVAAHLPPEFTM